MGPLVFLTIAGYKQVEAGKVAREKISGLTPIKAHNPPGTADSVAQRTL